MSADLSARHLRRLKLLGWGRVDSEVLKTCFSIVSSYSSLEELEVDCDTPGELSLVAESPCSACCSFTPVSIIIFEWLARELCFATQQIDRNVRYSFSLVSF